MRWGRGPGLENPGTQALRAWKSKPGRLTYFGCKWGASHLNLFNQDGSLTVRGFHFLPRFQKFVCYIRPSMAIQKKNAFSRRLPDLVTEELVTVLSQKKSFEFKQLFEIVHENLRQRNAASGGEEMLRLRAYEKLQNLVARGVVKKSGKIYKGDSSALAAMTAANTAQAAAVAASKS